MIKCPDCGAVSNEDFGMIICKKCQSIFFVDVEGNIQKQTPSPEPLMMDDVTPPPPPEFSENLIDPNLQYDPQAQEDEIVVDESASETVELGGPYSSQAQSEQGFLDQQNIFETPDSSQSQGVNFQDVIDYAHSELSGAHEGNLLYDLIVEGIDLSEVRASVKDVLMDSRFMWEVDEILSQIKFGKLEIKNLNAVKASILVQRFKELPVQVTWSQSSLIQGGSN